MKIITVATVIVIVVNVIVIAPLLLHVRCPSAPAKVDEQRNGGSGSNISEGCASSRRYTCFCQIASIIDTAEVRDSCIHGKEERNEQQEVEKGSGTWVSEPGKQTLKISIKYTVRRGGVIDSLCIYREPRENGSRDRKKWARAGSLKQPPPTWPQRDDRGDSHKSKCCRHSGYKGGEQGGMERENAILSQYYRIQRWSGQYLEVSLSVPTERRWWVLIKPIWSAIV